MTISILLCDDLLEERRNLSQMLRHYEAAGSVELNLETAADGTELLALWKPGRWDIIFLDIYMPQLNGIDTARQLRKLDDNCEIVFATTSREHGMEGYELHAMDYLTKPFTQQDVDGVMDWFLQKRSEQGRELQIRTQSSEESIPAQSILYIESRGHACLIHALGQDISVRRGIDELAAELNSAFFRCHKSFLLNLSHAVGIEQRAFLMDDGSTVPISASNLTRSKTALLTWKTGMV